MWFDFEQEKLPERRLLGVHQAEGRQKCVYRQQPHFYGNFYIVSAIFPYFYRCRQ